MSDRQHSSDRLLVTSLTWLPMATLLYLVRFHIGPLPTTLLEIYIGAIIVLFTIVHGMSGWIVAWGRVRSWRAPIVAWLIVTLIAVFVAPDHIAALGLWRAYILEPVLVFILLAAVIRSEDEKRQLIRSLFLTVCLLAAWAAIQFVTGWGIPHPWNVSIAEGRRATGPFPFPNALSLFVVPIGALAFVNWCTKVRINTKIRNQDLEFWTWLFALACVLFARSNGGLIALLIVSIFLGLLSLRTRKVTILITSLGIMALILMPAARHKVWRVVTFQDWSGQVRLFQWRETREMLKDHPIFGAGLGGYPRVFKPYHKATAIEIFQYPHNILLNFWSETGILGVIVFGWILVTWVWFCRGAVSAPGSKGGETPPLQWIIPLALLIHGLVDVPYFKNDLAIIFWILVFLTSIKSSRLAVDDLSEHK